MSAHDASEPAFTPPPLSCDCHFHVFGPAERYRYGTDLRYPPPLAPLADYLAWSRRLGFERYVFVQPSAYGRDNACMLDAMREVGAKCRGIVDIDENVADAEFARLHAAGVRGVRVNVSPVKPPEAGFAATLLQRIERLHARCAEIGWQLDFLTPGWLTGELMGTLGKLRAIAVTSRKRSPLFPAVPTVDEAGLPGYEDITFNGLMAPAGTPREILVRVQEEVAKAVRVPDLHKRFLERGVELTASASPEQFTAYVKAEAEKKDKLVREAGIKME